MTADGEPTPRSLYDELSAPFDQTHQRKKGGQSFTYLAGDDVIDRLNETLGVDGWSFEVLREMLVEDQCVCLGKLTVFFPGNIVVRSQWGGQPAARIQSSGQYLDLGDSFKGAATDALKKCATLVGVGLYLYSLPQGGQPLPSAHAAHPAPNAESRAATGRTPGPVVILCEVCQAPLGPVRFSDGVTRTAEELRDRGQVKFGQTLCATHFQAAATAEQVAAPPREQASALLALERHGEDAPTPAERDAYLESLRLAGETGLDVQPFQIDGTTTRAELLALSVKLKARRDQQAKEQEGFVAF